MYNKNTGTSYLYNNKTLFNSYSWQPVPCVKPRMRRAGQQPALANFQDVRSMNRSKNIFHISNNIQRPKCPRFFRVLISIFD